MDRDKTLEIITYSRIIILIVAVIFVALPYFLLNDGMVDWQWRNKITIILLCLFAVTSDVIYWIRGEYKKKSQKNLLVDCVSCLVVVGLCIYFMTNEESVVFWIVIIVMVLIIMISDIVRYIVGKKKNV